MCSCLLSVYSRFTLTQVYDFSQLCVLVFLQQVVHVLVSKFMLYSVHIYSEYEFMICLCSSIVECVFIFCCECIHAVLSVFTFSECGVFMFSWMCSCFAVFMLFWLCSLSIVILCFAECKLMLCWVGLFMFCWVQVHVYFHKYVCLVLMNVYLNEQSATNYKWSLAITVTISV